MSPKTIGLIAHTGKAGAAQLIRDLSAEFEQAGLAVKLESATAELAGLKSKLSVADLGHQTDLWN
jgi:hypothetical protein